MEQRDSTLPRVLTAERYRYMAMGSTGDASHMLIRQYAFPDTYHPTHDKLISAYHDRLMQWDYDRFQSCMQRYLANESSLSDWVERSRHETVQKFIQDMLIPTVTSDTTIVWTGWRVLGTVNRATGYAVWSLELFAKGPNSQTKVYSGQDAPNVEPPAHSIHDERYW